MKPTFRVFFIGLCLLFLAGCGSSSTPSPTPEPTPLPTVEPTATPFPTAIPAPPSRAEQINQQAFIRFVQGSWGLPEVDVYIDGAIVGYNMMFGQVTEPQPLVSGEYMLRLLPAGVDLNSHSQEPLVNYAFNLPAGQTVTLIMGGDPSNLNIQLVPENISAIEKETSRVTLIHALHNGGGLGVRVNDDVLIAPIGAYQVSHDAPIRDLFSRVEIITSDGTFVAEYDREFRSRVAVNLIMIGDTATPESVRLVNYTNRIYGDSNVQFVNASSQHDSVDVYLDGELVTGDLGYGTTHDLLTLKPADYQMEILPSGVAYQPSEVIYRSLVNLYEDEDTIIVFSTQSNRFNHLIALTDSSPTPFEQARVRFIHGLYDGESMDVTLHDLSHTLYGGDVTREGFVPSFDSEMLAWSYPDGTDYNMLLDIQGGNAYTVIFFEPEREPLVIVNAVGQESSQPTADDNGAVIAEPAITDAGGALVYMVNLVGGQSEIDLLIGNELITGLLQGNLISAGEIVPSHYTIQARIAGTENIFSINEYTFHDGYFYTIYVVGMNVGSPFIYVFEQGLMGDVFDSQQSIVQFLNMSLFGSDVFLVGLSDGSVQFNTLTLEDEVVPNRYQVAGEFTTITSSLIGGQVTYPQYLAEGVYQVVVLDANTDYGIGNLPNLNIQAGKRYDVVIQQDIETELISFVVVEYPAP